MLPHRPEPTAVYIGKKPLRMYVGKAQAVLREKGEVLIAARGNLIPRAILVAMRISGEHSITTFVRSAQIVGTDGKPRDVPSIEILLTAPMSSPRGAMYT